MKNAHSDIRAHAGPETAGRGVAINLSQPDLDPPGVMIDRWVGLNP